MFMTCGGRATGWHRVCRFVLLVSAAGPLHGQTGDRSSGMVVYRSDADFVTTVSRVEPIVKARGLFVMRVLDHAGSAAQFGRALAPNTVVLFGTPQIGGRIMACSPRAGIDLPQKLLVWEEGGVVRVAYNDPSYLVERHGIEGCADVLATVAENLRTIAMTVSGSSSPEPLHPVR